VLNIKSRTCYLIDCVFEECLTSIRQLVVLCFDMATSTSPLMRSPPTLWQRFLFAIRIQLIKALVTSFISLTGLPGLRNTLTLPSFTKVYACRPGLTNRVFIPKSYTKGDAPLPLYLGSSYFLTRLLFFPIGVMEVGPLLRACNRILFVCLCVLAPETAPNSEGLTKEKVLLIC